MYSDSRVAFGANILNDCSHALTVVIVCRSTCERANPYAVQEGLIDFNYMLCVGGLEGKDSCGGDSGVSDQWWYGVAGPL